jgi:hypothetical protein
MRNDYFTNPLSEAAKERNKVLVENCMHSLPMAQDFSDDDRGMICLTLIPLPYRIDVIIRSVDRT